MLAFVLIWIAAADVGDGRCAAGFDADVLLTARTSACTHLATGSSQASPDVAYQQFAPYFFSHELREKSTTPTGIHCSTLIADEAIACRSMVAAADMRGGLIVGTTTGGNGVLARNWALSLRAASGGRDPPAVLFCDSAETRATFMELLPGRVVTSSLLTAHRGHAAYKSKEWSALMLAVPRLVRWTLSLGFSVLYLDTDTAALPDSNLLAAAFAAADLLAVDYLPQVDGMLQRSNPVECTLEYADGTKPITGRMCGGAGFFRASPASIALLDSWMATLNVHGRSEGKNQPSLNRAAVALMRAGVLRVAPADCALFPNGFRIGGGCFVKSKTPHCPEKLQRGGSWWRAAQTRSPMLLHANWHVGEQDKVRLLQEWGAWFNASGGRLQKGDAPTSEFWPTMDNWTKVAVRLLQEWGAWFGASIGGRLQKGDARPPPQASLHRRSEASTSELQVAVYLPPSSLWGDLQKQQGDMSPLDERLACGLGSDASVAAVAAARHAERVGRSGIERYLLVESNVVQGLGHTLGLYGAALTLALRHGARLVHSSRKARRSTRAQSCTISTQRTVFLQHRRASTLMK